MDLGLKDRSYFVTGGSRGIGRAAVETLLEEGAQVGTCARNLDALLALRDALPCDKQRRLMIWACDVRSADGLQAAVEHTLEQTGRLDGVVAGAGAGFRGGVLETPLPDWVSQYELRIAGILNLVQAALPGLRRSDAGRVLILNAVTAHAPSGEMAAVSAARSAVRGLCQLLAEELARDRICVNAVNLGAIDTDRQKSIYEASGSALPYEAWSQGEAKRRGIPFGRMGRPEEVAAAVAFLLSPLASYITASSIDVSGGLHTKG